jgi:hypothetical protein
MAKFKLEADCIIEAEDGAAAANKLRLYFAQVAGAYKGMGGGPEQDLPIRLIPLPEIAPAEAKKK